ncbi:mitochondrial carrier [Abortiporus biennis]|nr:mitochondrial carrier [Abortiporus biennis]
MTSSLPPLFQAFSGAAGSAIANTFSYPLDLVATRIQTTSSRKLKGFHGILLALNHILKTEGWSGLYDGIGTDTAATLLSNFLYFFFYSFLRKFVVKRKGLLPKHGSRKSVLLSVPEELAIGFISGVASRAISTPLSVITVRLQTATEGEDAEGELDADEGDKEVVQRRKSSSTPSAIVKSIYQEQGLHGFWRGFSTTIILSLNPAITLLLFQMYRKFATHGRKAQARTGSPNPLSAFFGAAFSNAISTTLLYPLILAKTRLQVHRRNGNSNISMATIWERAFKNEGWAGIYQGLEAQIVKGFVSQGVTMMIKQSWPL